MSTLLYATLTNKRDDAKPDTSTSTQPPGVGNYVDALAALVPAEVLTAHGVLLTFTTMTDSRGLTTVTEVPTLRGAFFALIALSMVLYAAARWKNWDRLDYLRILIPPLAFVGWSMLQRATAFDAVLPELGSAPRDAIAIIGAILLGLVASQLAYRADQKPTEGSRVGAAVSAGSPAS